MMKEEYNISVAMSIYKNDVPEYLKVALDSIIVTQTWKPKEIVIIGDGPVPQAITDVVEVETKVAVDYGVELRFLPQAVNRGLGEALRIACENCKYDYIARMDSDDISEDSRIQVQYDFMLNNSWCDICGSQAYYIDDKGQIIDEKKLRYDYRSFLFFDISC